MASRHWIFLVRPAAIPSLSQGCQERDRMPYKINVRKYAYEARTYYGEVRGKRQAKEVHKFCEARNYVEEIQRQTRDKPREYDGQNIHEDRSCTM